MILQVPNYVKRVVFPLEVCGGGSAGISAGACRLISVSILLVGIVLCLGFLSPMAALPAISVSAVNAAVAGIGMVSGLLGVYVRDVGQTIALRVNYSAVFYNADFYPATAVPPRFQFVMYLNPLTTVLEAFVGRCSGSSPLLAAVRWCGRRPRRCSQSSAMRGS